MFISMVRNDDDDNDNITSVGPLLLHNNKTYCIPSAKKEPVPLPLGADNV